MRLYILLAIAFFLGSLYERADGKEPITKEQYHAMARTSLSWLIILFNYARSAFEKAKSSVSPEASVAPSESDFDDLKIINRV